MEIKEIQTREIMPSKNDTLAYYQPIIAVLGASGFVGRNLLPQLTRKGYRIRAGVRYPHLCGALQLNGYEGQVELIRTASDNETSLYRLIEDADYVINLVGILYEKSNYTFQSLHHDFIKKLASIAKKNNVKRIIHLSSIGADPHSESSYARSKADGEKALLHTFSNSVILRSSLMFGPDDNFFRRFASFARISPFMPLIDGGRTRFQPIYVHDVCRAVCKSIESKEAQNTIYEIGGPFIYSFKELMDFVCHSTRRKRLYIHLPSAIMHVPAFFSEYMPHPFITRDQLTLLKYDNIVSNTAIDEGRTLKDLHIAPTSIDMVVPEYLRHYRRNNRFSN